MSPELSLNVGQITNESKFENWEDEFYVIDEKPK